MEQRHLFIGMIMIILGICSACFYTGVTEIIIAGEKIFVKPSVKTAAEYLAQEIAKKWKNSNQSIMIGDFNRLDNGQRNLLCKRIELYLRSCLKGPQFIDEENSEKLKQLWKYIESIQKKGNTFNRLHTIDPKIKDVVDQSYCLIIGKIDHLSYKNIIYVVANAYNCKTGKQMFSTSVAMSYAYPDIKNAWDKSLLASSDVQPLTQITCLGKGKSCGIAYIAGQVLVNEAFVRQYKESVLKSKLIKDNNDITKRITEYLEGFVPPRIAYNKENPDQCFKDKSDETLWCAYVTGTIDETEYFKWLNNYRKRFDQ